MEACIATDRISSLPCDVIDNILQYLPLCDAVRTSTLSREWRYKWVTVPHLVFDWTSQEKLLGKYDIESIIDQILLLHEGSIAKFTLKIADFIICPGLDNWLHFLSNRRVEELTLCFGMSDIHPVISEHLFTLDHLRHLYLAHGGLRPPPSLKGFGRLVRLDLVNVRMEAGEFKTFISKCPMLEYMNLESYSSSTFGDFKIDINAPNLKFFSYQGRFSSICFQNASLLAEMSMTCYYFQRLIDPEMSQDWAIFGLHLSNVVKVLGQLPSITKLKANRDFLQYLAEGGVPQKLPNSLNHLRLLYLSLIDLSTLAEVRIALCLIRSSPNLQSLEITALGIPIGDNLKTTAQFLKAQHKSEIPFSRLENINICSFTGLEPEMEFVKLLLLTTTLLRKLKIHCKSFVSREARHEMLKELVSFHRASTQAEIIFRGL